MTITSPLFRDSLISDRRLRRKDDVVDDPSTYAEQYDPGTIFVTVGGVIDVGDLTISLVPLDDKYPTPDPIVAAAAASLALSASALHDAVTSDLTSTAGVANNQHLPRYFMRSEYTAAAEGFRIIPNPHAPPFQLTMSGTGGTTTLTYTPDDIFPITAFAAKQVAGVHAAPTHVAVSIYSVTAANDVNAIGTCTFDLQGLRIIDRYDRVAGAALRPAVEDEGTLTGLLLGEPVEIPLGGGRWGVRMTNIANTPAGHDAFAVHYREVVR